jgi:hypothetical protein
MSQTLLWKASLQQQLVEGLSYCFVGYSNKSRLRCPFVSNEVSFLRRCSSCLFHRREKLGKPSAVAAHSSNSSGCRCLLLLKRTTVTRIRVGHSFQSSSSSDDAGGAFSSNPNHLPENPVLTASSYLLVSLTHHLPSIVCIVGLQRLLQLHGSKKVRLWEPVNRLFRYQLFYLVSKTQSEISFPFFLKGPICSSLIPKFFHSSRILSTKWFCDEYPFNW